MQILPGSANLIGGRAVTVRLTPGARQFGDLRFEGAPEGLKMACGENPKRVYGDKGGLTWGQENPNFMTFTPFGQPAQILTRGGASPIGTPSGLRTPPGHPEGWLEGFATIYKDAATLIRGGDATLPTVTDGLSGMRFIQSCIESNSKNGEWIQY